MTSDNIIVEIVSKETISIVDQFELTKEQSENICREFDIDPKKT